MGLPCPARNHRDSGGRARAGVLVRRLRGWLVRRLAQPEIGEVRRIGGRDVTLREFSYYIVDEIRCLDGQSGEAVYTLTYATSP